MQYLIVNHIPAHPGRDAAHRVLPRRWVDELRAQAAATRMAGGRLLLATPLLPRDAAAPENDDVEVRLEELGIEHLPTLGYDSARGYLASRSELQRQLRDAVEAADVVQLDDGGHPVPVGLDAHDAATAAGKKRVWVFGREDPTDRLRLINLARRAAKRLVGHTVHMNMASRLHDAVRSADLVLAHSPKVSERFADCWDGRCHLVERVDVHDHELLDGTAIEARRQTLMSEHRPLRLLAAGRQVAISGTDHVLRAVAKVRRLHVPVELVVAGDGQDLDFFRSIAWQLGLETGVRFVQERDAVTAAWTECDMLVSGALSDVVPREVMLAVARGLVPVMYGTSDADDQQGAGRASVGRFGDDAIQTVNRGDIDKLADRIIRAAGHRSLLVQRMYKGLAWVKPRTVEATHRTRATLVRTLLQ